MYNFSNTIILKFGGEMGFSTSEIRTVSISGHGQTGKTSLMEHILFTAGIIDKPETIESGKTVSDYSQEEISRHISIHNSLSQFEYNGKLLNLWDTPGSADFVGEVITAFRSSELAIVVIDAKAGVQIETVKLWRNLNSRNKPRIVFINKMDDERADFDKVTKDIHEKLGVEVFPVTVPMGCGEKFHGVIDVLSCMAYEKTSEKIEQEKPVPMDYLEQQKKGRNLLAEAAAEGDDDLFVKFLDEGELTQEEIYKGLRAGMESQTVVPIFCGSATDNSGLIPLMRFITDITADPSIHFDIAKDKDEKDVVIKFSQDEDFSGFIIKTSNDQFSGKMSYIKIVTGNLSCDSEIWNVTEQKKEKIGKIFHIIGKKLIEIKNACAGDIVIAVKLPFAKTNDTLSSKQDFFMYKKLLHPEPVYSIAVSAKDKKTEDKMGELLLKATEEDETIRFEFNSETKQNVLSGMGELQIGILLEKIKNSAKIELEVNSPRIPYRETIQRKAQAEYTHKKQSGGHGQYAKVVLSVENLPRGENYKFTNAIFGGAISKSYIPGVEKGIQEAMESGVLAGYPVVDIHATVLDGKEHPVDSSELAFKIASRNAFKEAMKNAGPILLEPIMNMTVFVETKYLGDILSDLSSRRGKVLGQESLGNGIEEIRAQVPQSELLKYSIDLRAMTSGTGSFELQFSHYDSISGKIADAVIKAATQFNTEKTTD